jgi:retron-type reverse transcriptase
LNNRRDYITDGYTYAVDIDLEMFFDTVNQSKLMEVLSRTVNDGRVISLIHKYFKAGVVACSKLGETEMGVPQGKATGILPIALS